MASTSNLLENFVTVNAIATVIAVAAVLIGAAILVFRVARKWKLRMKLTSIDSNT